MKSYISRETTPLTFHKFINYFSLPLGFIITLSNLLTIGTEQYVFVWMYLYDIVFSVLILILIAACFFGLHQWKPYGWYCVMIYWPFMTVYRMITGAIITIYSPDYIGTAIGSTLGVATISGVVLLYYYKRKHLFIPLTISVKFESSCKESIDHDRTQKNVLKPIFCRKCGFRLVEGSVFCSSCGERVE